MYESKSNRSYWINSLWHIPKHVWKWRIVWSYSCLPNKFNINMIFIVGKIYGKSIVMWLTRRKYICSFFERQRKVKRDQIPLYIYIFKNVWIQLRIIIYQFLKSSILYACGLFNKNRNKNSSRSLIVAKRRVGELFERVQYDSIN